MRQTLILHIGTHKTGSTTIQNYLYYNRLWLRRLGVFYPRPMTGRLFYTSNHSDLRDTARSEGKHRDACIHPEIGPHDALLGRYVRAIKEVGQPINILSAEGLSSHLNRYARRLAPLQQHFTVKVLAYMRRPDIWIEKFYSQRIANIEHAEKQTFARFVQQPHIETYLYNRHRMFGWWAKAFGAENVTVIPFEPAVPNFDLIAQFLKCAGIKNSLANHLLLRHAKANQTLSPLGVEMLREMNANGTQTDLKTIRKLKRAAGPEGNGFLRAPDRQAILTRAAPDMARICDDFVRDGRTVLFPNPPERLATSPPQDFGEIRLM